MLKMNCDPSPTRSWATTTLSPTWSCSTDGGRSTLEPMIIDGRDIASASANLSPQTNRWTVGWTSRVRREAAGRHYRPEPRYPDGDDAGLARVVSAPVIQSTITTRRRSQAVQNGFPRLRPVTWPTRAGTVRCRSRSRHPMRRPSVDAGPVGAARQSCSPGLVRPHRRAATPWRHRMLSACDVCLAGARRAMSGSRAARQVDRGSPSTWLASPVSSSVSV